MTNEDYVNLDIAFLLDEKGFNEKCEKVYMNNNNMYKLCPASCCMEGESLVNKDDIKLASNYATWIEYTQGKYAVLAPSLYDTMKWLRKKHDIYITILQVDGVTVTIEQKYYFFRIQKNRRSLGIFEELFLEPEEAMNAAILYCLKNKI